MPVGVGHAVVVRPPLPHQLRRPHRHRLLPPALAPRRAFSCTLLPPLPVCFVSVRAIICLCAHACVACVCTDAVTTPSTTSGVVRFAKALRRSSDLVSISSRVAALPRGAQLHVILICAPRCRRALLNEDALYAAVLANPLVDPSNSAMIDFATLV